MEDTIYTGANEKWRDGDMSHLKLCSVGPLFRGVRFDENSNTKNTIGKYDAEH